MDRKTCIDILTRHNAWRRDDNIPNSHEMVNPTELELAIDYAVIFLSEHQRVADIKREWARKKREQNKKTQPAKEKEIRMSDSERKRLRYQNDEEYREKDKERSRKYYWEHREEIRAKYRNRYLNDDDFRHNKNKRDCDFYHKQKLKDNK